MGLCGYLFSVVCKDGRHVSVRVIVVGVVCDVDGFTLLVSDQ